MWGGSNEAEIAKCLMWNNNSLPWPERILCTKHRAKCLASCISFCLCNILWTYCFPIFTDKETETQQGNFLGVKNQYQFTWLLHRCIHLESLNCTLKIGVLYLPSITLHLKMLWWYKKKKNKLELIEVKWLSQDHSAGKGKARWALNWICLTTEAMVTTLAI